MSMTAQEYTPIILPVAQLLEPITVEKPGGYDCRLSGDMNILLSFVTNRKREANFLPQYASAYSMAITILRSKSKDLSVAIRLVEASLVQSGIGALADGFILLNGLCEQFWLTLYPEYDPSDAEARGTAIGALQELLMVQLHLLLGPPHEYQPPSSLREGTELLGIQLGRALQELDKLDAFCYSSLGDVAPNLDDLRKEIQIRAQKVEQEYQVYMQQDLVADERQREEEHAAEKRALAEMERAKQRETAPAKLGEFNSLDEVLQTLHACTDYLMEHHTDDPLPYIIHRGLHWYSKLLQVRPSEPPAEEVREVASLVSSAQPKPLLQVAERCFCHGGHQWIDLQWYQVLSAERLGKGYHNVAFALKELTACYMRNHSELDGMEIIPELQALSEGAKKWIGSLSLTLASTESSSEECRGSGERDAAEVLAKSGKMVEALTLLVDFASSSPSGRESFLRQLQVVEFALKHGQARQVIPMVERLSSKLQEVQANHWEDRHFLERMYHAAYECYLQAFGAQKAPKEKVEYYYSQICSVNPGAFIKNQ